VNATRADWKAYLDWQGDMGTEEVVLAAPMIYRPVTGMTGAGKTGSPTTRTDAQSGPGPNPTIPSFASEPPEDFGNSLSPAAAGLGSYAGASIGPEFFTAIAEKLAKPEIRARNKPAETPASAQSSTAALAATNSAAHLPAFEDLEAYWTWLAAEYARLFPAAKGPIVRAVGHAAPRLAVVELAPTAEGLFGGESGASSVLLDKMMTAIGLRREDLYLTAVMKTPPTGKAWARKDVARMLPALFRELKMAQCGLVLVLGEVCAQAVLRTGTSIPDRTGKAVEAEGLSLSATWHPDEIRAEVPAVDAAQQNARPLSREAWTHLQWLRGRLPARGS
jgi:uracil-DNA glycosylase family 4